MLDETPEEVKIFVRKYSDLVVLIHSVIADKGYTQKELAGMLNKQPSEISKWLAGDHNFTLRSLAKLEAVLGVDLIQVPSPKRKSLAKLQNSKTKRIPSKSKS